MIITINLQHILLDGHRGMHIKVPLYVLYGDINAYKNCLTQNGHSVSCKMVLARLVVNVTETSVDFPPFLMSGPI